MDGPSGEYRPRTAGQNGSGVRDWQRNTWFGPAPLNSNPFDEPEDAPELKESRSANVNEHMGDFWAPHQPGYVSQTGREARTQPKESPARNRVKEKKRRFPFLLGVLVFFTAVFVILRFTVFAVQEIQVTGNVRIPAGEIIRISGIRQGNNILTLNEKDVERRITSDYRLRFRYMAKQLPGTVVLSVREREACCWFSYCGIFYVLDRDRMVLSESENLADTPAGLVEVRGLEVRSNTLVGQMVNLGNALQQSVFTELFVEMKVLGCTEQIRDADISNTSSILLTTRDGFTVSLGDRENIHAKLRSMLLVREELHRQQINGGTINVSNPEVPIYSP